MLQLIIVLHILSCVCAVSLPSDKPKPCGKGQHWVRPHHRSAYVRADGTHVSAADVTGHCQNNPAGFDHWNPKRKSGLPAAWQHPEERPKAWSEGEWERVLEALSELPDVLWAPPLRELSSAKIEILS